MPQLDPQQPPPPDYYADNVGFVLRHVQTRCGALLTAEEHRFVDAVLSAGSDAQRLFARLVSRRGRWIRLDALRYAEVACLEGAVAELAACGLVERTPAAPADALLNLLTRPEQQLLFPRIRAATKPAWVTACVSRYPDAHIRHRLAARHPWLGVPGRRAFAVCQVLFFGSDEHDLSAFVIQDLGLLRYESYPLGPDTRPFRCREELDRYLRCRGLAPWSKVLEDVPAAAGAILEALWEPALTRAEQRARDRVLNRVGRWHERRGDAAGALVCYHRSTSHPARERRARLLHQAGRAAAVETLLAEMRADPWGPEEEDFAGRFPRRRRPLEARVSTWKLAADTPVHIERFVRCQLTANTGQAWHLENLLPLGLAGLAYWDEVFAPVPGAFSHPLQHGPHDLFWPDFARSRRQALDARRQALARPGAFAARLREVCERKRGTANRLVHWGAWPPALLEALLTQVPDTALRALADYTIRHLDRARTGFPDLLVIYGHGAWELVEVKGPTDQLQPAQRVWLRVLAGLEVPARVLRLRAC